MNKHQGDKLLELSKHLFIAAYSLTQLSATGYIMFYAACANCWPGQFNAWFTFNSWFSSIFISVVLLTIGIVTEQIMGVLLDS